MPMFNFTAWLRQMFPRTQRASKKTRSLRRTTLRLEQLEDRIVPAYSLTDLSSFTGANGANPTYGSLIQDASGNLFGTSQYGGAHSVGTVFEVAHGSSTITDLASFNPTDSKFPAGGLVEDASGNLFGTTSEGGASGYGTVFEWVKSTGFITDLASFNSNNGQFPYGGLVEDGGGNLFGTTYRGGALDYGTVFEVANGTSAITTLASFSSTNGANPIAGLVEDANGNLFGTTYAGGASNHGTVFEVANGTGAITTLASFSSTNGAYPVGGLVQDASGNLFGTTQLSGANGYGTVFEVVHGSGTITDLASFNRSNGANPVAGLVQDASGNLFGTTSEGGASGYGTVFEWVKSTGFITDLASFNSNNGQFPYGGLVEDANGNLFGTTYAGGTNGVGTVFELANVVTVTPTGVTGVDGSALSGQVATLDYGNDTTNPASFTATISWSDNTQTNALVTQTASGAPYVVSIDPANAKTFAADGVYTYTVSVVQNGVTFTSGQGTATVTEAAPFSVLASFTGANGANPFYGSLVQDAGGNLFGTTYYGGANGVGTVFEIVNGSSVITDLASFNYTNGAYPYAGLVQDASGNLFGTTYEGGASGIGTVFEVVHGSGTITDLASFNSTNGAYPYAGLVQDASGNLFGTTQQGGANGYGTVFEVVHNSGTITDLASFNYTNGAYPYAGLVQDASGNLFGTTQQGGANGYGTVFEVVHNSGTITDLASFNYTNGAYPYAGLVQDASGNLFGTTQQGGANGYGTVFEVVHNSGAITDLASFNRSNGANPVAGLVQDASGNLFGTTQNGGGSNVGTVFEVVHGSGAITDLATFNGTDGANPLAGVVQDASGNLFGTTNGGGANGYGTVFEVAPFVVTASGVSGPESTALSGQVATFIDGAGTEPAANFTATITWSDNTTSQGVVTSVAGVYVVTLDPTAADAKTYAEEGGATYTVTVTEQAGQVTLGTITSAAANVTVTDPPLTSLQGVAAPQNATEGQATTVTLATFQDAGNPSGVINTEDYTADVDFGDGNGTQFNVPIVVTYNNGTFTVTAAYTYAEESASGTPFTVTTQLHHEVATDPAPVTATVAVSDPAVIAQAGQAVVNAPAGGSTNLVLLATFTDPAGTEAIANYPATVDWGDGTTEQPDTENSTDANANIFIVQSGNRFLVEGTHVYNIAGNYTITTTIHHDVAPDAVVTEPAVVASPAGTAGTALSATGGFTYTTAEGAAPTSTQTLATFTDLGGAALDQSQSSPTPAPGVYAATVSWGDGSAPDGTATITVDGNGLFTVSGSHQYAEEGTYTIGVLLQRTGAPNVTVISTAVVGDAALTAGTITVGTGGVEGVTPASITAAFTDADANATARDFSGTINWGDGSTTPFTSSAVSPDGLRDGGFTVSGSHHYAEEGTYAVTVTINDKGGSSVTDVTIPNVVTNGGFETGDFTGWAETHYSTFASDNSAHSGSYAAYTGAPINTAPLSQYVATLPGQQYTFGFWVKVLGGGSGTEFHASWNGTDIYDEVNGPAHGYQFHSFTETATSTSTLIEFDARNDPSFSYVDDVAVSAGGGVVVADAPLAVTATPPATVLEGVSTGAIQVATFTDADPAGTASDYSATIHWGDGTADTAGTIVNLGGGTFGVTGAHTYAEEGQSATAFSVTVTDAGSAFATGTGTKVTVTDAPLTVTQLVAPATATEGVALTNVVVATFTDADAGGVQGDYSATIQWGNGTSTGTIVDNHDGTFTVTGSHAYADEGTTTSAFAVTVTDAGRATVTRTGNAVVVADAALTAGTLTVPSATEGAAFGLTTVFHFTDANPVATAADFTATVHTGDAVLDSVNNSSQVQVIGNAGGGFDVKLAYTYAEELSGATFSVRVADVGGQTTGASGTITVADQPITPPTITGLPGTVAEGVSLGAIANFATFTDPAGPEATGDYTATIHWGDGSTSAGTVTNTSGNTFQVSAPPHTYTEGPAAGYNVTVSVQHDSLPALTSSPANIAVTDLGTHIQSITVSKPLLTDADAGHTFTVAVTYNEPMDTTPANVPTIGFSQSVVGTTLTAGSGSWNSTGTVYTFSYTVADANVAVGPVDVTITGGKDANLNAQNPSATTLTGAFSVDTVNPTATTVASPAVIGDGTTTFTLTATYSKAMDPTVFPGISFSTGTGGALALLSQAWTNSTTFVATYSVTNTHVTITNITASLSNARDTHGNLQVTPSTSNTFRIDTQAPSVTAVTPSVATIADAQVGSATFTYAVTFSEAMNTAGTPLIAFSPSVASTLTFTSGTWSAGNTVYTATYNVADANTMVGPIAVSVSNAQDAAGNAQQAYAGQPAGFTIDTLNPSVTAATPSATRITTAQVGGTFTYAVTFSKAMSTTQANTPSIAFSPNVASTLAFASGAWTVGNTVYTATYTVANASATVGPITVTVSNARDTVSNAQVAYAGQPAGFTINTGSVAWSAALPAGWSKQVSGDFNGDGKTDLATYYAATGKWLVSLSTGTGFAAPTPWITYGTGGGPSTQVVGDFTGTYLNGHRVDDIASFFPSNGTWWVAVPNASHNGFTAARWSQFPSGAGWSNQLVGDFNGDGKDDIANYNAGNATWTVCQSTNQNSFTYTQWTQLPSVTGGPTGWTTHLVGDFNGAVSASGHRIDDIANFNTNTGAWWVSISKAPATLFVNTLWASYGANSGFTNQVAGDFNGDGKDDIANFHASDATWIVNISTGTSFVAGTSWGALPMSNGYTSQLVGDFNHDGKADIASFDANSATWSVSFANNTGTGFTTKPWVQHATVGGWSTHLIGDFNGDGVPDLADFQDSSQKWWVNA